MDTERKIFYDVTELCQVDKGTGIQRVTRAILDALRRESPVGWQVLPVYGDPISGLFHRAVRYETSLAGQNTNQEVDSAIRANQGDIFLSIDLTYNITPLLRATLINMREAGVGIYFVVYDLIPVRYPQWFSGANSWFEGNQYLKLFEYWLDCVTSEANGLICISETVQRDLANWFHENSSPAQRVPSLGYFHPGSDIGASIPSKGLPVNTRAVLSVLKSVPTFLMVGTLEPRKGHAIALDAFEILWSRGIRANLVIVGKPGWKIDDLLDRIKAHPALDEKLYWLNGISDEYLEKIYRSSLALLALSEAEGFGLPLVEATHFHLPVIARDIEVFREVTGGEATFFSGKTAEDLADLIVGAIEPKDGYKKLQLNTRKAQSWNESKRQLFATLGCMSGVTFQWNQ